MGLLTLIEAADRLGVDPGTLRVQVHNGKLKARKIGPIWTVTPREVERYRRDSLRIYEGKSGSHSIPCTLIWCRRPTCVRAKCKQKRLPDRA